MDLYIHKSEQGIGALSSERTRQGLGSGQLVSEGCAAQTGVTVPLSARLVKMRRRFVSLQTALLITSAIMAMSGGFLYAQTSKSPKEVESVKAFRNKPSILMGKSIAGVELGMTELQVKEALKSTPDSITDVNEQTGAALSFNKIQRQRYVFKRTEGFNILYEGTNYSLFKYAQSHYINKPNPNDTKELFFTDVLFKGGKVVQVETDMPTYFAPNKANIQSPELVLSDAGNLYQSYRRNNEEGTAYFFTGSRENGISLCIEALGVSDRVSDLKSAPVSRMKIIVHPMNTFPITGNGIEEIGTGW